MISTKELIKMLNTGSDKISVYTHYQNNTKKSARLVEKIINIHENKGIAPYTSLTKLIDFLRKEYHKSLKYLPYFTDSREYELSLSIQRGHAKYRITNKVVQVYTIDCDGDEEYIFNSTDGMSNEDFFNLSLSTHVCDVVLDENVKQIRKVLKSKKRKAAYVYSYHNHNINYQYRLKRKKA
ncbi:hypothetical protein XaC1_480 [Xanthomonas phage XaC1]|nr:hypothetical protein XaC1_480 [Xanthomonas phage XaC1]